MICRSNNLTFGYDCIFWVRENAPKNPPDIVWYTGFINKDIPLPETDVLSIQCGRDLAIFGLWHHLLFVWNCFTWIGHLQGTQKEH